MSSKGRCLLATGISPIYQWRILRIGLSYMQFPIFLLELNITSLIFPPKAGIPEDAAYFVKRRFFPALTKAKLPKIRFHYLRHTYAALVWEQTKDVKYLQTQLGHSSLTMTMDVYGHLMNKTNQDAATRLGNAIFGDDGSKTVAANKKEVTP